MRIDDRLSTVLRLPATGGALARVQYRQLLDLLGTGTADDRGSVTDAAYARLAELESAIPAGERAAMLRSPALRLRNPRLVAQLAEGAPQTAGAAIAAASLTEEQWRDLVPALDIKARGYLRHRRDLGAGVGIVLERLGIMDRGLPPADPAVPLADAAPRDPAAALPETHPLPPPRGSAGPPEGIGAIVRRIEAYRKAQRDEAPPPPIPGEEAEAPRLPLGDAASRLADRLPCAFDFTTDTEGRIDWADPAMAPMAVGLRLGTAGSANIVSALRFRQPIETARAHFAGAAAIAGGWIIDAAPRFARPGGQFTGYSGRMRRPVAVTAGPPSPLPQPGSDADRMRQILHELRSPVNAIQGFAEMIQQGMLGPAPHEYRALAATIASDAALILAGFEELDRLAKLDSGAETLEEGVCDLAAVVRATVAQLESYTAARSSGFELDADPAEHRVRLAPVEAERLAWRLLATLGGGAAPGEILKIKLRTRHDMVRLTLRLPQSLASRDDSQLFHATAPVQGRALSAGMFGAGFSLRLAAAEARAGGGSLIRKGDRLRLELPALTGALPAHSDDAGSAPAAAGHD